MKDGETISSGAASGASLSKVFSQILIVLTLCWLLAEIVYGIRPSDILYLMAPELWQAMVALGGPMVLFFSAGIIYVHVRDNRRFAMLDRLALGFGLLVALMSAAAMALSLISMRGLC